MGSPLPHTPPHDLPESLPGLLAGWLPRQRWFPAKSHTGSGDRARMVGGFELSTAAPGVRLHVTFVEIDDAGTPVTLLVPLSVRRDPLDAVPETALIGRTVEAGGESWVYDATADRDFMAAWLDLAAGRGTPGQADTVPAGTVAWCSDALRVAHASRSLGPVRVLSGEQSNTSVVVRVGDQQVIVKFFRVLRSGLSPEVVIGRALAGVRNNHVPAMQASVNSAVGDLGEATLCVIHTFVAGGRDGWELALAAAAAGTDFAPSARAIGEALGNVHGSLRSALGAHQPVEAEVRDFTAAIIARLQWAWDLARAVVGPYDDVLAQVIARLRHIRVLPELQQIHGDLHLGQLISAKAPGKNQWYVLDFEGEPLRAMADRGGEDLPLRDVVGMLRSFDYAAAHVFLQDGPEAAAEAALWTRRASDAFISGYRQTHPGTIDTESVLFMALWLDKALYEVVYELQNRPNWVSVPVHAVQELLDSMESGAEMGHKKTAPLAIDAGVLASVSDGSYYAPHSVLGAHLNDDGLVTIRTLRHLAKSVAVVTAEGTVPMNNEYGGIWVAVLGADEPGHVPDYRLDVDYGDGVQQFDEPYRYLPTVGELDLHLMAEGRHETLWTVLGAHVQRYHSDLGSVDGVSFAVWAPGVQAVRVVGEFNGWDGREHAMRSLGTSGVWELFIPGVSAGARYKFKILSEHGQWLEKADPMAFGTEVPPLTASRVVESNYTFGDDAWMAARAAADPHNSPMSVYEVHLGSWRLGLNYKEMATELVDYVKWMGFTHVELMPVSEHPFGGSWGYQVTSYYAPTSRFGHPDEFRFLVDSLHQAGIGVIMDWVPAHFPKDEWALAKFNGQAQYEHADPRLGEHPDWGTLIFDFGRNEVRNFLVANALYWFEEFHIDGLRVDAVASMLYLDYSREEGQWSPNRFGGRENLEAISFLQEMNATAYRRCPGIITIAEESTAFPGVTGPTESGGLGFGIKWNMGWMHDSLAYMAEDPINRGWHHNQITFSMVYAFTENFMLPISHDEVVHGKGSMLRKMPGDRWQQLANLRAYLAFQWAHPGKQLIFMGTEFGQESEWSEQHGLDWWLAEAPAHRGVQLLVKELNEQYGTTPALYSRDNEPAGFTWLNGGDTENNVLSFVRWDHDGNPLVCVVNFAGNPHEGYRVGVPSTGAWEEVLNTDAEEFGGSGVGNPGVVKAVKKAWDGQGASVVLRVPPLGALYLRPAK